MLYAPFPVNEVERLKDLYVFDILDSEAEEDFNDLAELVAEICKCPIASVTFIDKDRQWFKAQKNMLTKQGPRSTSFCGHAILEKEIFIVEDAVNDTRFFDNPDVVSGLKIGFYAGAPIKSSNGFTLGSVCAIDNSPRKLTPDQLNCLKKVANQVSKLLDLRIKNKQIKENTELLLAAEKKIAQLNFKNAEQEKFRTAYLLHEEIAQTALAIKMYLNHVKQTYNINSNILNHSINELENLTTSIKQLSRKITPTTLQNDNYALYINKAIEDVKQENNIAFDLRLDESLNLSAGWGLLIYRIIQDILKLSSILQPEVVFLDIFSKEDVIINVEYSGINTTKLQWFDMQLHQSNIFNRIEMLNGKHNVGFDTDQKTKYKIEINIPFE